MPMVPEFQGNIPQVRDNGSASVAPVQLAQSSFDYGKVLDQAMKPMSEFANSAQKTLQVWHARTVKAESDDAEQQVVGIINNYMYDPENGYFSKKGRDAMDGYQASVDGMQKDIDKVVGGLQPAVREAIYSRLQDRMTSALSKADRWRAEQTHQYTIESSKGREAMLEDDAALHYDDPEYLEKTWGAIELEIDYQLKDEGWPVEKVEQYKKQKRALFDASRYTAWAEKDPVSAFQDFRAHSSDMDPEIKRKLHKQLFVQSQDLLSEYLASKPFSYSEEEPFVQKDLTQEFNTALTDDEEKQFQAWIKEEGREKDLFDYDLRGAWKEMQSGSMEQDERGHLGDKYKKPNHPTFSNESIYSNEKNRGGRWEEKGDKVIFTPGRELSKSEANFLQRYFNNVEPGVVLNAKVKGGEKSWMDDPLAKTGDPLVDSLTPVERLSVVKGAIASVNRVRSAESEEFTTSIKNSYAKILSTGKDDNPMTQDEFVRIYGPKKGAKQFAEYEAQCELNANIYNMKDMTGEQMQTLLKSMKPVREGNDNYASEYKAYEQLQKAMTHIVKQRTEDPVQFAIQNERFGFEPLNLENREQFRSQLMQRQSMMTQMKEQYGVTPQLLSKTEAKALVDGLDKVSAQEKSALLTDIYESVGEDGVPYLTEQLKGGRTDYAIAMAGMGDIDKNGVSLGTKYLIGREATDNKRVQVDASAELGTEASIRGILETEYDTDPEDTVEGVFSNKQANEATVSLAMGVWAYNVLSGNVLTDEAVKQSAGEIYVRNNKKIVLPRGMDDDDFEEKLVDIARGFNEPVFIEGFRQVDPQDIPNMFATARLQTERRTSNGISYSLTVGGRRVVDKKGNRVFIEVKQ